MSVSFGYQAPLTLEELSLHQADSAAIRALAEATCRDELMGDGASVSESGVESMYQCFLQAESLGKESAGAHGSFVG